MTQIIALLCGGLEKAAVHGRAGIRWQHAGITREQDLSLSKSQGSWVGAHDTVHGRVMVVQTTRRTLIEQKLTWYRSCDHACDAHTPLRSPASRSTRPPRNTVWALARHPFPGLVLLIII